MRLRFLGTGTSAGVPAIGCTCAVCTSIDPRDRRLRTSGALRYVDPAGVERVVLLDAGPDLRQQALVAGLDRCDAVLLTHNHVDHVWGLDELRRFNALMRAPIPLYANDHTLAYVHRVYQHIFDKAANINDSFVATLVSHRVTEGDSFEIHGLRVTPVPLLHGRLRILGYRFDSVSATDSSLLPLAWCTDVSGLEPAAWGMLAGVRTLVLDALRERKHNTHLSIPQAITIAQRIGADRTYFVHMGHEVLHEQVQANLPQGIWLAHDGLELTDQPGSD